MIIAKWNYHNTDYPCLGYWSIICGDTDYSNKIPIERRTEPMGTLNNYCFYKGNHYTYKVMGDDFPIWITKNPWVKEIPVGSISLYNAIRENDWVCGGSCYSCVKKEGTDTK